MQTFKFILVLWLLAASCDAATYYVSKSGHDTNNNGLGPDASHGTNRPWLTIGKFNSTAAAGDTLYIGPGVYREVTTLAQDSFVIEGDPLNTRGFKDAGGELIAKDIVRLTAYLTNDTTAGSTSAVITGNGKDGWTLRKLYISASQAHPGITMTGSASTGVTLENCVINGTGSGGYAVHFLVTAGTNMNFLAKCCVFTSSGNSASNCISVIHEQHSADWDANMRVENSILDSTGYNTIGFLRSGGSGDGKMGGFEVVGCYLKGDYNFRFQGGFSTSIPCLIRNNYCVCADYNVVVQTNNGEVDSDYNLYVGGNGHSYNLDATTANFALGANDETTTHAPLLDFGGARLMGFGERPFFGPTSPSPLTGAGDPAHVLATDIYGRSRPSPNGIGPLEFFITYPTGGLSVGTLNVGSP